MKGGPTFKVLELNLSWYINVLSNCSVLIYAEADKDSTEDEKTEKEQPAEKQKKERPSSCDKVDKMCKFIYSRDTSDRI